MAEPINELHNHITYLNKRLAEIEKERQKTLKIPVVTDVMVDEILLKVRTMLDSTDPKELKTALSHFIERIEINGQNVTIEYTFKKPSTEIVPTIGDPGGSATTGNFTAHLVLDTTCLTTTERCKVK